MLTTEDIELTVIGRVALVAPDGRPGPSAPQQRLLISLLAAQRGRTVSVDSLLSAMWGDNAPPSASGALHALVAKWRAALEPTRSPRTRTTILRTAGGGYRLELDDHRIDEGRFRQLVARGRTTLAKGDPFAARPTLTAALAKWQGPPFGEFADHPALSAVTFELMELRLLARESLADAQIRANSPEHALADLELLVSENPYREDAWALLMTALYCANRQADALAAYRRCGLRLRADLGIEPGSRLRSLHERILLQEALIDSPSRVSALSTPPVRRPTLPPTTFVGRERERVEIHDHLARKSVVTITGPGGVGKTRLALEIEADAAKWFDDGTTAVDLREVESSATVPLLVAEALSIPNIKNAEHLVAALAARRALIILDNADQLRPYVARLAAEIATSCPEVRTVVTCRRRLEIQREAVVRLWSLDASGPASAAVRLFMDRAALAAPGVAFNPDLALSVCRRLDGLPIALELAAGQLRSVGIEDLPRSVLDPLEPESRITLLSPSAHRTLRTVMDWSIGLLAGADRALLRRVSVFPGWWSAPRAAELCEYPGDITAALTRLTEQSLVQREDTDGTWRYRLLEVIRADGLARLFEHDELSRFRNRWAQQQRLAAEEPGTTIG